MVDIFEIEISLNKQIMVFINYYYTNSILYVSYNVYARGNMFIYVYRLIDLFSK